METEEDTAPALSLSASMRMCFNALIELAHCCLLAPCLQECIRTEADADKAPAISLSASMRMCSNEFNQLAYCCLLAPFHAACLLCNAT